MIKKILSVGQCALDHSNISEWVKSRFDVQIVTVDSHHEAMQQAVEPSFDLIFVNRVFDLTGTSGLDTIAAIVGNGIATAPVMLVSNFPDAQQAAIAAGAVPGFGKNDLSSSAVLETLAPFLAD